MTRSATKAQIYEIPPSAVIKHAPNPSAWVDLHGDYLYSYAFSRLRDEAAAEDAVQETLLSAIQSLKNYRGQSSERTWLTGILKHKIVDYIRAASKARPFDQSLLDLSEFDALFTRDDEWSNHWNDKLAPIEWKATPESLMENLEFQKVLDSCVGKLPDRVAQVFVLREIEEMTGEEVCETMELSSSNYWTIMHRARMSLRRCLELNWFKQSNGKPYGGRIQ